MNFIGDGKTKIKVDVEPSLVAFSGQLRFSTEEVLEEVIEKVKMRVDDEIYNI